MIRRMKGTYDITDDIGYFKAIEKQIERVSRLFNYKEIRTPHFESRELFHRSVGEDTDIVSKETYDFEDRGGRINTLRPEGTAGIVRAYNENKLYASRITPQKYYYYGSMFRYERPQKGRFREFRQFGAEAFGSNHPSMDAEVIAYAVTLLKALKIKDVTVHMNSLGDKASKTNYEKALKEHFEPHLDSLCKDCNRRFDQNPLRILDCKVDAKHESMRSAPKTLDYLTDEDKAHFESVQRYLEAANIEYTVDHNLVRGLDYYTHTVFEIKVSEALLGSQNAICGGGRYNNLVESLDGPPTPAVGFAFGIERMVVALKANEHDLGEDYLHVYLLIMGEKARIKAMQLSQRLRMGGLSVEADYMEKSFKAQFKQSATHNARFVAIIGDQEVDDGALNLKDQRMNTEERVAFNDLYTTVVDKLTSKPADCKDCDYKGESE